MEHLTRNFEKILLDRLKAPPTFIQTILGPRQVGKTSGVLNVLETHFNKNDFEYHSCEEGIFDSEWFLSRVQKAAQRKKKIIVFDEIQKLQNWSELVKSAWDAQKRQKSLMSWVLLGSSSLKLGQGLSESLSGRFEILQVPHWTFLESKKAFGLDLDTYLNFGGYPASYSLIKDMPRFRKYMIESIFETVVGQDILRQVTIKKPSLFRQTFMLACQYPAQEVSYNKLLGQLQEAGNVEQIKHYLELFSQAFLLRQVYKYSKTPMSRLSSPKLIVNAPVFSSLFLNRPLNPDEKGRVFESVVGQILINSVAEVSYWRDGYNEVDYVVENEGALYAVEVKSQIRKFSKYKFFKEKYKRSKFCMVDFENFEEFETDPLEFIKTYSI